MMVLVVRRDGYERKTSALIGQRILSLSYWDVNNYGPDPRTWDYGDWHQAVMGVELVTDRGRSCVMCTDTFYLYGVEVFAQPVSDFLIPAPEGPHGWEVQDHRHWSSRLGGPVQEAATFWERLEVGSTESYSIPVALRLDFEAGPVWMVAATLQWPDVDKAFVPGDEILVVFAADRMRKIGFPETGFLA